jgi:acetylglutamate kinase
MSTVVAKFGGAVSNGAAAIVLELAQEHAVCVVHGAGPQISAEMERRGVEVRFVDGRRVTTEEGIEVVRELLADVNAQICAAIGPLAVGLMGDEIGLRAEQVYELGLVGDPLPSRPAAVLEALAAGLIPVVAPLAAGPLNVNADEAAAQLAVGIDADEIEFVTDVIGLLDQDGVLVPEIAAEDADALLDSGILQGGIIPKLEAAVFAARAGVRARIGETVVQP